MNKSEQTKSRAVLPIISLVTFLGFLDTHLLIPVIALYASELGAGVGIIGLIVGLYSLTNTPANIAFGRLMDRIGYKLPLIIGLIGDALSMFLYSLCHLPLHLALVRVFHGISGGLVGPSTMTVMADYPDKAREGRAMGIYGISLAAATLFGYALSGIFVSWLGYHALFWFGAAMLIIGTFMSLALPGTRKGGGTPTTTEPGGDLKKAKELFRRRGLIIAYCAIFAQYFAFGGLVTLLPLHVKGLGMETFHMGMLLAIFAIVFIAVQIPSGALSDRMGRLRPIVTGLCLGMVSLLLLPLLGTFTLLALGITLYGIAYGLLFPSISASVVDHTAADERGIATGIFHALLTAGVAIGAPVMGWVGEVIGIESGLISISGIMVLAIIAVLTASKRASTG